MAEEIDFSVSSLEDITKLVDNHRLDKLRELAKQYNELPEKEYKYMRVYPEVESSTDRPYGSEIGFYENWEDYVFSFWMRCIHVPEVLAFGEKYDSLFERWVPNGETWDINDSDFYKIYKNPEMLGAFLYMYIKLPKSLNGVNILLNKLNLPKIMNRGDFKTVLKNASVLDLCYILLYVEDNVDDIVKINNTCYTNYLDFIEF